MARIVVIQHRSEPLSCEGYSLQLLVNRWQRQGHEVMLASGTDDLPDGDLAFLHVNLSVVPESYLRAARHYPRSVNARAVDIRKRHVSRNILSRVDEWDGPVIVKSDLNCNGVPEYVAAKQESNAASTNENVAPPMTEYRVFRRRAALPEAAWSDPRAVVERFLPERDERGFYLRTWIFLGERECSRRFLARKPVIKGKDYIGVERCDVPEFLRTERERLGLEYGKMDFVVHGGEPILLDANKTMGIPPATRPTMRSAYAELAEGIQAFLNGDASDA